MAKRDVNELAKMIKGIAYKASKQLFDRSPEDIEQDLWVKVLETDKRKGYEIDLKLAAKVCWDYIKDMIDYDQRRSHSSIDLSGTDEASGAIEGDEGTDFLGITQDKGKYDSDIVLKDLYDKFPDPKSKERIFLDFWGNASGAHPNKNPNALPEVSKQQDGYTESALAKLLGFGSSNHSSYKTFRRKMRNLIADYYGL